MSRMFKTVTRTWHVFSGCRFDCEYCWARDLILGRLKRLPKYQNGFVPTFHPDELTKSFKPGEFVGVALMGDISFAREDDIEMIMDKVIKYPETKFLFQSKNPAYFHSLDLLLRIDHIFFGTTIESNRTYRISSAPFDLKRMAMLAALPAKHKFVSIEPIMDFDVEVMLRWIRLIRPEIVEVGADNYHHQLQEPSWGKVETLLEVLREFVPQVVEKEGLERLK